MRRRDTVAAAVAETVTRSPWRSLRRAVADAAGQAFVDTFGVVANYRRAYSDRARDLAMLGVATIVLTGYLAFAFAQSRDVDAKASDVD